MHPSRKFLVVVAALLVMGGCKDAVAPIPVATIGLSDNALELVLDETQLVVATPREQTGNPLARPVVWSSSAPTVAGVVNGLVTAKSIGNAVITASAEGVTATATVSVYEGGIVSPGGNLITGLGGNAVLNVPSAAVTQSARIIISVAESPPASPRLVRGTAVSLRIQAPLASAAVLTIKYDPAYVQTTPESGLRLFQATATGWQRVSGSTVDVETKTVRGSITSGGIYGVLVQAAVGKISVRPRSSTLKAGDTTSIAAVVEDVDGDELMGRTIAWSTSTPDIVSIDPTTGIVSGRRPGVGAITATAEGKTATTSVTVTPGDPANIVIIAGNSQSADTGSVLPIPLSVRVTDRLDFNVPGVSVRFEVTAGRGSVTPASGLTDADGIAAGVRWILGPVKGRNQVTASIANGPSVVFDATASQPPPPVAVIVISPAPATIPVGQTLTFAASVQDVDGNVLSGRPVAWSSANPEILRIDAVTGSATARQPGATVVTATAGGKTAASNVTVSVGPASRIFIVAGNQQTADTSTAVPIAPSVRVNDALGYAVVGATVSFSVTGGGGSVTPATVVTDATGTATIARWVMGRTPGTNTLTATTPLAGSVTLTAVATQPAPQPVRIVTFGDSNTDVGYYGTNPALAAASYVSSDPARMSASASNHPTQLAGKIEIKWSAVRANPITAVNHGISGTNSGAGRTSSGAPNARESVNGVIRFQAEVLGIGAPWSGGESGDNYPQGAIVRQKAFVPAVSDFAYISTGTNDFADNLTPDQSAANIEWMIDQWVAAGHAADHLMITTLAPRAYSNGNIPPLNSRIRSLAAARGVGLIELAQRTSDDNGATWRTSADHIGDSIHYSEVVRDWLADQVVRYMLLHQ